MNSVFVVIKEDSEVICQSLHRSRLGDQSSLTTVPIRTAFALKWRLATKVIYTVTIILVDRAHVLRGKHRRAVGKC